MTARALCFVCFKPERGFGFDPALRRKPGKARWFCSRGHQLLNDREQLMTDFTTQENEHIWRGICVGGEYLDSLGKTDLAVLTREELVQFGQCLLQTVVEARLQGLEELDDEIPF